MTQTIDYAEEGRKLLDRVNLDLSSAPERYALANAIFKHPETGATLYVGNYRAAESLEVLNSLNHCRRIVFCQDGDGSKHHESNPEFCYLAFPIGRWRSLVRRDPKEVAAFFRPLFDFLDKELGQGNSVLIHCLAGAHRAGTAGISSLMYLLDMNAEEATKAAQMLRPAINPIGDFPTLLSLLEMGLRGKKERKVNNENES